MYFDPAENTVYWIYSLLNWVIVTGGLTLIVLMVSFLTLLITRGTEGVAVFGREILAILVDIFSLSPRRIWALSRLTYLEAYRRKALAVFVVFGLLFMFAGWFIGETKEGVNNEISRDQVKVYISFVLTSISWLTIPVVLIVGCFGIPEDIRLRSIHTVVTKPARRLEIVLGRMIGISMVGGVVLLVMGAVGHLWIVRQTPSDAQDLLTCRVPVYGDLGFINRDGQAEPYGINTGDIWAFRSYIEGSTKARAMWRFYGIDESVVDSEGFLNFENSFSAFRSYKGDMTRSLLYDIKFINPENSLSYTIDPQQVSENRKKLDRVPRKVTDGDKQYDLIKDFVTKDKYLHVEVSCLDREQYIGMARPDLYIRMPDNQFWVGYWKAIFGVGLRVLLIAMIGVSASAIVKGPIATILTFVFYLLSGKDAHDFMDQLFRGDVKGGGPLESIYRLWTHMNPSVDLPDNPAMLVMKYIDYLPMGFLWLCKQVIPRLQSFNMTEFVANGFDVPFGVSILPSTLVVLAFFFPCVMLGYFSLRIRELESK